MRDDVAGGRSLRALRLGIAVDGTVVPKWISFVLSKLDRAPIVDVALVVIDGRGGAAKLGSGRRLRPLLFALYENLDYRVFRSAPDAFEQVDVADDLAGRVNVLRLPASADGSTADGDLESIRSHDLDVILWLATGRPSAGLLDCARFGVWGLYHGDPRASADAPPFASQLLDDEAVAVTGLQIFGAEPCADRVIYRSHSAIDPHSLHRSRNPAYWKAANFPLRRLEHLHRAGWGFVEGLPTHHERPHAEAPTHGIPSNLEMLRFFVRLLARGLRSRLRNILYSEAWFLAFRRVPDATSADGGHDWTIVSPPRGRSFADPFVIRNDDRHYVFFEEYIAREDRGIISYVDIVSDARTSSPHVVLERDHHLSYPFVFTLDGDVFMVPETAEKRAVELHRAVDFPRGWVFERRLLNDIAGVDATIVAHAGKLWLFMNVAEHGVAYSDELYIFFADSLEGHWTPHWLNPVVSDVRSARPAGRIFERDEMLIRPGQDSSRGYGSAVVLHRIEVLSEEDYRETPIARVDGSWYKGNLGTHTYDADDRYEVIDGRRWERRLHPLEALLSRWRTRRHDDTAIDR